MTENRTAWADMRWKLERMEGVDEFAKLKGETLADHEGYYRTNDGGWIVSFKGKISANDDVDDGGQICVVAFKGTAKRGQAWNAPDPVGMAFARLIAAAPYLYEALREAKGLADMAVMSDDQEGTPSDDQAVLEKLRARIDAALAKAEGQS